MHARALALVFLTLSTLGCAPALSTFVPAKTTPKGHVRASAGLGANLPTGQIADFISVSEDLAERGDSSPLTEAEKDELMQKTAALLFNPPSVVWELQGRYGFHDRADAGVRFASGAIRADGRFMPLAPERDGELAISVGLGFSYYSFEVPVPPPIDDVIEVDDFRRYELDVPLLFGWSWPFAHVWLGPKVLIARYTTGMSARFVDEERLADVSGTSFYYGAQVGGAVGYRWAFVGAELTVARLSGSAEIEFPTANESLSTDFDGIVIYPTIGLLLEL